MEFIIATAILFYGPRLAEELKARLLRRRKLYRA